VTSDQQAVKRLIELHGTLEKQLVPFPRKLSVTKDYGTADTAYCGLSGARSYFSIDAKLTSKGIEVELDGIHDCGRKVWGPLGATGSVRGKVALLEFPAHLELPKRDA